MFTLFIGLFVGVVLGFVLGRTHRLDEVLARVGRQIVYVLHRAGRVVFRVAALLLSTSIVIGTIVSVMAAHYVAWYFGGEICVALLWASAAVGFVLGEKLDGLSLWPPGWTSEGARTYWLHAMIMVPMSTTIGVVGMIMAMMIIWPWMDTVSVMGWIIGCLTAGLVMPAIALLSSLLDNLVRQPKDGTSFPPPAGRNGWHPSPDGVA